MIGLPPARRENRVLVAFFGVTLLAHFYFSTTNWTSSFLPGHEFRQTQTALVSHYIDEQNNFSLLYETPVIGKPWISILLEVPVYEWTVVLVSRVAHLPHFLAARTVSLFCFYLALPPLYLLLGRLGVSRPRRLLTLALVLTCPVYIFYSRAFLMESMAVMCCAWFLVGFVRTMDGRSWTWLAVTNVAGTAAALIKSVTFAVWLLPAAGYGVWIVWRETRAHLSWRAPWSTVLWGAATVLVPLGALQCWISYTDPIKAAHHSAWIFTAKNLSQGNWGLIDLAVRFSAKHWSTLLLRWREAIMPPWIIGLGLAGGIVLLPRARRPVVALAAVFFLAQLMFPFAYADQDYYFYACTVFLLGAFGFVCAGLLDSRLPRWLICVLVAVPFFAQVGTYWQGYHVVQSVRTTGGSPLTNALHDLAPKDSVLIVAGADWAAIIPYYSRHRALMIRSGLEYDAGYLQRAFGDLADEKISALVMVEGQRTNRILIERVAAEFDLDNAPTFSLPQADVYFNRAFVASVQASLKINNPYTGLSVATRIVAEPAAQVPFQVTAALAGSVFAKVAPAPFQAYSTFGYRSADIDGDQVINAHPDCDLWIRAPEHATVIKWDYGIQRDAYENAGGRTDGVEFIIAGEIPGGFRRRIYRRALDPVGQPADRGHQHVVVPFKPRPGEVLIFSTRPYLSNAFDWAYWQRIEVK